MYSPWSDDSVKGIVDDELRALLEIQVGTGPDVPKSTVLDWVVFGARTIIPRSTI
jgi:hypothetical protein